jgi:hypothetical protein
MTAKTMRGTCFGRRPVLAAQAVELLQQQRAARVQRRQDCSCRGLLQLVAIVVVARLYEGGSLRFKRFSLCGDAPLRVHAP